MRRLLTIAALGAALLTPAAAQAALSTDLDVGVRLIEQPASQPWEVDLLLGAALKLGGETLAPTTNLAFRFPKATVNPGAAAATCTAKTGTVGRLNVTVCPAGSKIGTGTANVKVGEETIPARLTFYRGPGTAKKLAIYIKAEGGAALGITVTLKGTLQRISEGSFGYRFDLPVPKIPVGTAAVVRLMDFQVDVGTRGGKRPPFIQAPRSCPRGGFPFTIAWTVEGGKTVTDRKAISCVISATD